MKNFQLDIITPTSLQSFKNVSYLRIPALDGLTGIKARHATAIIGLGIGEIKIRIDGKDEFYATSGGYADIKKDSVSLVLETAENASNIDIKRSEKAIDRASKSLDNPKQDLDRAKKARSLLKKNEKLFNDVEKEFNVEKEILLS